MKTFINLSLLILGLVLFLGCTPTQGTTTVLKYTQNHTTIVILSMSAKFVVTGDDDNSNTLQLNDENVTTSGDISTNVNQSYHIINFIITWNDSYQFILKFNSTSLKWVWINSTFVILHPSQVIIPLEKMITSFGDSQVSIQRNQSYVCRSALDYSNAVKKLRVSITWNQFQVEVYPTNNTKFDPSSKPCTVDLDDKIVPIAVGGALGLLLLLVVIIYVISYIRDRRQQSKELRSGYNRIDQPEPNHHS